MRAGGLRCYGAIQAPTETATASGTVTTTWTTQVNAWAAIQPLRGREYFDGQTVEAESWYRLTLRYDPGQPVTEDMSFLLGSTRYEFRSVGNVNLRDRTLEIMAVVRA